MNFRTILIFFGIGVVVVLIVAVLILKWRYGNAVTREDEEEIGHHPLEEDPIYLQHLEQQMIRRIREEAEEKPRKVEEDPIYLQQLVENDNIYENPDDLTRPPTPPAR